jgi:superfamily I DNA and/or RNA helicase
LAKIQQEQRTMIDQKTKLVKKMLQSQQKVNLDHLATQQKLLRELSKKRKMASLKSLFPQLVKYLPFCLTTPEVITAITDLSEPTFDFLVFDEASQMPLEKSIPLWARAKKCIIIGDEQQLPPTDFFKTHFGSDEEI